jgi:chitinase
VDYQDVRDNYLNQPGWTYAWDATTQNPTLYNASLGQFITYDNAQSIAAKVAYAKNQGMLGLMVWELDADRSGDLLAEMQF